jgi:hypothetical protein
MATLKVNLSAVADACEQDTTPAGHFPGPGWYAFLADCHGNPFVHAGKEYGPFPIDHGYVEIADVPPGRYLLFAIVNPFFVGGLPGIDTVYQSNFVSHFAIVEVCCGCKDYCIALYNSGWHYCVRVIVYWFELLAKQKQLPADIAKNAISALTRALDSGTTLPGDGAINEWIGRLVAQFGQKQS